MYKVLSIDGGGIRGLIPALVLTELESITGKPCSDMFDLIAGTSTGGIIALGLTMPDDYGKPKYAASDLAKIYTEHGKDIFKSSPWRRIRTADAWLDNRYPAEGIEKVLTTTFGDARLKDTLTDVLVTAYALERRIPFFFKTRNAVNREKQGYDFALREVARATSAAPTYFEPAKIESKRSNTSYYSLVDGGVYANNPAMCAYVEARRQDKEIYLLSLGTGSLTRPIEHDEAKDWGKAEWARPMLDVVFDGVSDTVNYQLEKILGPENYHRIQTKLVFGSDDLDDVTQTNLKALSLLASELITEQRSTLHEIAEKLK